MKLSQLLLAVVVVVVSLAGQVLVKSGLQQVRLEAQGEPFSTAGIVASAVTNIRFLLGFATLCVSAVSYIVLLYTTELSRAVPVMSGAAYVLLFLSAYFILHEKVTLPQTVGFILVLAGMYLIAR